MITIDSFIRYGSLWTLILGVVSLGFAIRSYRRQTNAQIFFEIASRYHGMLQSFPVHQWTLLNPKAEIPESSAELTSGVFRYMAVVHFAFTLHELRYLSKDLWKILQAEHRRTLAMPLFVREWNALRVEFNLFPSFLNYVDSIQMARAESARDAVIAGLAATPADRYSQGPPRPPGSE